MCKARYGYAGADRKDTLLERQKSCRDKLQQAARDGKQRLSHSARWNFQSCPNLNSAEHASEPKPGRKATSGEKLKLDHPCEWPVLGLNWCKKCEEREDGGIECLTEEMLKARKAAKKKAKKDAKKNGKKETKSKKKSSSEGREEL